MITCPMLHGRPIRNDGCGRTANENNKIAFWQSRMTTTGQRAEPIALTDIPELARQVRRGYAR